MGTAFMGVDVVRIGVDVLVVAVIPLHGNFDRCGLFAVLNAFCSKIHRFRMKDFLVLVVV